MHERSVPKDIIHPATKKAWELARTIHDNDQKLKLTGEGKYPPVRFGALDISLRVGTYQNSGALLFDLNGKPIPTTYSIEFMGKREKGFTGELTLSEIAIGIDGQVRSAAASPHEASHTFHGDKAEDRAPNLIGDPDMRSEEDLELQLDELNEKNIIKTGFKERTGINLLDESGVRALLHSIPMFAPDGKFRQSLSELDEGEDLREPVRPDTLARLKKIIEELAVQRTSKSNFRAAGADCFLTTETTGDTLSVVVLTRRINTEDGKPKIAETWKFPAGIEPIRYSRQEYLSNGSGQERDETIREFNIAVLKASIERGRDNRDNATHDEIFTGLGILSEAARSK